MRIDRLTSRAIDCVNGLRFQVEPGRKTPNGRTEPDPDRADWHGRGVLEETPTLPPLELGNRDGSGNDLRAVMAGTVTELSVDHHRWPQASQALQGDRLQTDDLRRFEIVSVNKDGLSRVVLQLAALKG